MHVCTCVCTYVKNYPNPSKSVAAFENDLFEEEERVRVSRGGFVDAQI